MRRISLALILALLLSLVGCHKTEQPPETDVPPVEETDPLPGEPLHMDTLRLEISRNDADKALMLRAVRELPELLRAYFAEADLCGGIAIDRVEVTVGTSAAATAQALAEGKIDLAFLPAEDLVLYGGGAQVLQGNAPQPRLEPSGNSLSIADWNGSQNAKTYEKDTPWDGGTAALVCAAPTEYGRQLAKRAESGAALTWAELDKARWGVLAADSMGGYRCANLYLADHYKGNEIEDLSDVTRYDSYEDLLRAAAEEEIDLLVIRKDARMDVAEAWTLECSRAGAGGMQGFGRKEPVWEEVRCVAVTETLYTVVAASAPGREELSGGSWFNGALEEVLYRLYLHEPELMGALGSARFVPLEDWELDALRRALTIEGKTA